MDIATLDRELKANMRTGHGYTRRIYAGWTIVIVGAVALILAHFLADAGWALRALAGLGFLWLAHHLWCLQKQSNLEAQLYDLDERRRELEGKGSE